MTHLWSEMTEVIAFVTSIGENLKKKIHPGLETTVVE